MLKEFLEANVSKGVCGGGGGVKNIWASIYEQRARYSAGFVLKNHMTAA